MWKSRLIVIVTYELGHQSGDPNGSFHFDYKGLVLACGCVPEIEMEVMQPFRVVPDSREVSYDFGRHGIGVELQAKLCLLERSAGSSGRSWWSRGCQEVCPHPRLCWICRGIRTPVKNWIPKIIISDRQLRIPSRVRSCAEAISTIEWSNMALTNGGLLHGLGAFNPAK